MDKNTISIWHSPNLGGFDSSPAVCFDGSGLEDFVSSTPADIEKALGAALGRWGAVETELYLLFLSLVPFSKEPDDFPVIFSALRSLETKIRVIDALVNHKLEGQLLRDARDILTDLKSAKDIRNQLAHWAVYGHRGDIFLAPHQFRLNYEDDGTLSPLKRKLSASDLTIIGDDLLSLAAKVRRCHQSIKTARKR